VGETGRKKNKEKSCKSDWLCYRHAEVAGVLLWLCLVQIHIASYQNLL